MAQKEKEVKYVSILQVKPDKNQPRRNFPANRLADLMKSITKHGIISPLLVEKLPGGFFLIVDGERRYRAATQLGLKEIPVNIREAQGDSERLIEQFHIQEQHEGWTALEKAVAVHRLAEDLKLTVPQIAEILNLPGGTIRDYMGYADLLEKKEYEKNEIPLVYAPYIVRLKSVVKKQYMQTLEEEFTREQESELEIALINRIKNGSIVKKQDILQLIDSVKTEPRSIEKYMEDDGLSSQKLFLDSKAQVAWLYRNINNAVRMIAIHGKTGINLKVGKFYEEGGVEHRALKNAHKVMTELLETIEK